MRIGILTVPFNNNYGGYLQAFALLTTLKELGHEPTIIMYRHKKEKVGIKFKINFFLKNIIKGIADRRLYPLIYDREKILAYKGRKMIEFESHYLIPQTERFYTDEALEMGCRNCFDAICVGSDQVWRAIYVPNIDNYFLAFTNGWNLKRFAYAASFGTDEPEYTQQQKQSCSELIKNFDAISVREESALSVIESWGCDAAHVKTVLDPTLLLKKEQYLNILDKQKTMAKGKIFCYVLDKTDIVKDYISRCTNYANKEILQISDIQVGMNILPSVETWLAYIRDCDLVITDSFHGTVFSIIMNKPFVVVANGSRGIARFVDLLQKFGLRNRIVSKKNSPESILGSTIDWDVINNKIELQRQESFNFIKENFKKDV